jgi:hypothetical protein
MYSPRLLSASLLLVASGVLMAPRAWAKVPAVDPVRPPADRAVASGTHGLTLAGQAAAACGHSRLEVSVVERQIKSHIEQLRSRGAAHGNSLAKASAIHAYLHSEILRGKYQPSASDVAVVLAGGDYNCASVSALFLTLAEAFDLDACAASVIGHVWCRVRTDDAGFDIETTCRDWFALAAARADFTPAEHARQSQAWQDHRRRVAQARELDQSAFVAVFHYNRGVQMLRQGDFTAAAAANLHALELDLQCEPAYGNLWAALGGEQMHEPAANVSYSPRRCYPAT